MANIMDELRALSLDEVTKARLIMLIGGIMSQDENMVIAVSKETGRVHIAYKEGDQIITLATIDGTSSDAHKPKLTPRIGFFPQGGGQC